MLFRSEKVGREKFAERSDRTAKWFVIRVRAKTTVFLERTFSKNTAVFAILWLIFGGCGPFYTNSVK